MTFALFVALSLVLFGLLQWVFWRKRPWKSLTITVWCAVPTVLAGTWLMIQATGEREEARLVELHRGFAPVFSDTLSKASHDKITETTSAKEPVYQRLQRYKKRWFGLNNTMANMFSLRELQDGKVVTVLETAMPDQPGGREMAGVFLHAGPGQEITNEQILSNMREVIQGKKVIVDRKIMREASGSWLLTFAPVYGGKDGAVDGVLAVIFTAREWDLALYNIRMTCINYCGLILLGLASLMSLVSVVGISNEERDRRHEARVASVERDRIRQLVNSIDGVVYEMDAGTGQWIYVSKQVERILGYQSSQFLKDRQFMQSKLHEGDRKMYVEAGFAMRRLEYRVHAGDGRTVWLREAGSILDTENQSVLRGVLLDVTKEKDSADQLARVNRELMEASRQAGMAEVATGVLHNVGNVLNTVNVSANLIQGRLQGTKLKGLEKLAGLMAGDQHQLLEFLTNDSRGKNVPAYLLELTSALTKEQAEVRQDIEAIVTGVNHLRHVVSAQQDYARPDVVREPLELESVIHDAVKLSVGDTPPEQDDILVQCELEAVPALSTDRHKVMQILINLLRNSRQALHQVHGIRRAIRVQLQQRSDDMVAIKVQDNGVGILEENLTKIFGYGYSTRKDGHGFGLHTCALAARSLGGNLLAASEGYGRGAEFTLLLPSHHLKQTAIA